MTTRYRIAPCSGRYLAIYNGEREMPNRDIITRLMAQDTEIRALRLQLANAHEALGCALALLNQESYNAARIVLDDALKGSK